MRVGNGRVEGCRREAGVSSFGASWGRTSLYGGTNALNTRICKFTFAVAGYATRAFSTRFSRSRAPFSNGLAGAIR